MYNAIDRLSATHPAILYPVIWIVLTAITTIAGPFGTYSAAEPMQRLLLWSFVILIALGEVWTAKRCVLFLFPDWPAWLHVLGFSALFSVMFAAFPMCCGLSVNHALHFFGLDTLLIASSVCVLSHVHLITGQGPKAENPQVPRILRRVPDEMRGQLMRITVRDHYVDIYTDKGKHRVLMRLRDATEEAEADGLDGFCVHRSHWVMRDAIERVERISGRDILCLTDGSC